MNAQARKALLALSMTPLSFTMGCDLADDGFDENHRFAESEELDAAEDLAVPEANGVELDDILDDEGRPLTSEILVVRSSPEEQHRSDVTADGDAPSVAELGHAIGIGPDDVPIHADDLVAEDDPAALALNWAGIFPYGNNWWGLSYDIIQGNDQCGGGQTRAFGSAYATGAGSCYVVGWYSALPTDCRIRVRINHPGWFATGQCDMFVYTN